MTSKPEGAPFPDGDSRCQVRKAQKDQCETINGYVRRCVSSAMLASNVSSIHFLKIQKISESNNETMMLLVTGR